MSCFGPSEVTWSCRGQVEGVIKIELLGENSSADVLPEATEGVGMKVGIRTREILAPSTAVRLLDLTSLPIQLPGLFLLNCSVGEKCTEKY